MFYDLVNPKKFASDIEEILDDNGVWCVQISYLASMLRYNNFYDICHEHLEYYTLKTLRSLMKKNGLHLYHAEENRVNGGSAIVFISHIDKKMNDTDAIEYITKLKGLGVWSAEMFLMFNLNRSDIFPVKDIGLLRAISKNYKVSYPPSDRFLKKISKLHSGYRTVFTWYMWRSIDPTDVEY